MSNIFTTSTRKEKSSARQRLERTLSYHKIVFSDRTPNEFFEISLQNRHRCFHRNSQIC